jgi:AraC-like DNA-binding protein
MNLFYKEYKASDALKPYVYGFWSLHTDGKDDCQSPMQRCFPAGTIEWIISIRGKNMKGHRAGLWFDYPRSIFTGICDKAAEWMSYGNAELFGVRLTPEAAIHLFDMPLKNYQNSFINAEDFLGSKISPIIANMISAETIQDKLFLMETFLHTQIKFKSLQPDYFTAAMKLIRSNSELNIASLSKQVYVSERQLQRSFQAYLGISPKAYLKTMRLYKAHRYGLIRSDNYSSIAYQLGYADPAHFTRDFKDYFGVPPEQHFSTVNMKWVA